MNGPLTIGRIVHFLAADGRCIVSIVTEAVGLNQAALTLFYPREDPIPRGLELHGMDTHQWHWPNECKEAKA